MVSIDWLILADAAQVVGGKLYLMGGGWDVLTVNTDFPVPQRLGIAVAFRVPWTRTNEDIYFEVEILDQDGGQIGKIDGQFQVGRPPGLPIGTEQRTQFAADFGVQFQKPGAYAIIARVGEVEERTPFRVVPGPGLRTKQPGAG